MVACRRLHGPIAEGVQDGPAAVDRLITETCHTSAARQEGCAGTIAVMTREVDEQSRDASLEHASKRSGCSLDVCRAPNLVSMAKPSVWPISCVNGLMKLDGAEYAVTCRRALIHADIDFALVAVVSLSVVQVGAGRGADTAQAQYADAVIAGIWATPTDESGSFRIRHCSRHRSVIVGFRSYSIDVGAK